MVFHYILDLKEQIKYLNRFKVNVHSSRERTGLFLSAWYVMSILSNYWSPDILMRLHIIRGSDLIIH